jgi:3-hydroxy-9,10-secoandrosta-1,3,5(10)-triene-9,17-dione monooxygenase
MTATHHRDSDRHWTGVTAQRRLISVSTDVIIELEAPEPDLTPETLIARARALRDELRERQALTEELTRVSDEMHETFLRAGFYRMVQPRRFGGHQFSLRTFDEVIIEIARGCPSTGWQLSLASGHAITIGGRFSEHAQREIFGPDGDFRAPLPVAPTGTALRLDDGYVVNGRWDYASGCTVSTHFLAGVMIDDDDGEPLTPGLVCVPDRWTVLDNWGAAIGFRGSGSNSVVVDAAFVPERYVLRGDILNLDLSGGTVGGRLHDDPMYAGQTLSFFNLELVPILVGTAWAALDEYRTILSTKQTPLPPIRLRRELPEHQRNFGLALARTEAAQRILLQAADDYVAYARRGMEGGPAFSVVNDRRLSMSIREAGLMAAGAVEMVAAASGTSASVDGERMQRYLRDVQVYKTHINAQQGFWAADLGADLLGEEQEAGG